MSEINKVVLAYSGGLDTSVILKWLQETYQCEVVTFTADIGQGEELEPARAKALAMGVQQIYIDDLREEFVRDFVFPMFRANTVYEGEYLLGTSIARPLIAKRMIEIANLTGADAVAHGATGKGNDQVRFELTAAALAPELETIAPWRDERFRAQFPGRAEMIAYCESKGIPVQASAKKPFSRTSSRISATSAAITRARNRRRVGGVVKRPLSRCAAPARWSPDRPRFFQPVQETAGNAGRAVGLRQPAPCCPET